MKGVCWLSHYFNTKLKQQNIIVSLDFKKKIEIIEDGEEGPNCFEVSEVRNFVKYIFQETGREYAK